jgi:ATP-dependent Clp protease protease subunit
MNRNDTRMEEDEKPGTDAGPPAIVEKALFKSRVVLLTGEINDVQARRATSALLALAGDNDAPITFFLSSPGGHVESGDMIHDVVRFITPKVPNTRFLLHEPRGGIGGMASDIEIQAREIIRMRERLNKIFADATDQSVDRIKKDTDRDHWMLPDEALAYGLVGKVVKTQDELS